MPRAAPSSLAHRLRWVASVAQLEEIVGEGVAAAELIDPVASAEAASLRYVTDETPGIRRRKRGERFAYVTSDGSTVTDESTLGRIKALAIPPAWSEVWICPSPNGHLQATGRDARGRKQYRYHPRWRKVRDAIKYDRLVAFAEALPRIRERVDRDISLPGMPREKVVATVVRLLEETRIRVGNEEYRKQNKSFGLTTLQDRHVRVQGSKVRFHFRGKHGKVHDVELSDHRLARTVQRCRDVPGQELFQYVDADGQRHDVTSGDVNAYLREIGGGDFTAKDFRTWAGTLLAARFFRACEPCESEKDGKKSVVRCVEVVAAELGNTVAVCRKCYIHPAVIEAFLHGALAPLDAPPRATTAGGSLYVLSAEEAALIDLLRTGEAAQAAALRESQPKQAA